MTSQQRTGDGTADGARDPTGDEASEVSGWHQDDGAGEFDLDADGEGGQHLGAGVSVWLSLGQCGGQDAGDGVVEGRDVGLVEVEDLEQGGVDHAGLFGGQPAPEPQDRRRAARARLPGPVMQDADGVRFCRADRGLQLVDQQAFGFVQGGGGRAVGPLLSGEGGQAFGDRRAHVVGPPSATGPYIHSSRSTSVWCVAFSERMAATAL